MFGFKLEVVIFFFVKKGSEGNRKMRRQDRALEISDIRSVLKAEYEESFDF